MSTNDILAHLPHDGPVTVIVIREPDAPNEVHVYGADDYVVVDVDNGAADLTDRTEFLEWASSLFADVERLPDGPARWHVYGIVKGHGEMHGLHTLAALQGAIDGSD
jgi:hypothetical protein